MDYRERWELKNYLIGQTLGRRIRLFQAALVVLLLGFLLSFWNLQAVHGEAYANLAENNRLRRVPAMPTRGVIFDRRHEVLAATRPSLDLVLLRDASSDVEAQLRRLVPILGVSYDELADRVSDMRTQPAYEPRVLREDVGLPELAQIEARRELFPSLVVRQRARRNYTHGDLFGHVIGYVGEVDHKELKRRADVLKVGDIIGKSGLERAYDERLRGERGWNLMSVNNLGRRVGASWVGREPEHGHPLELTVDIRLQEVLKEALGDEAGAGVFMDPGTGEVLALVSTPAFDPSMFADGMTAKAWRGLADDPRRPLHDRAIASYYAPGSVFKVVMAIAGLETGAIDIDHTVHCKGVVNIYGHDRLCWKKGGHGKVNLRKALAHSCNVYFYLLGKQLGIDAIHAEGAAFGLGRPTGIDVPGEAKGILGSKEWKRKHTKEPWYPGDTISVAIGQGLLAVTPVQMATMMSAVATKGQRPRPHINRNEEPDLTKIDVREETFDIVRQALRDAVRQGTGRSADLKNIAVAGKTGTAQVYKHSAGVDSDELPKAERDHAWFVGYAPQENPSIAFAVVVEHGGHGGSAAAPIVRRVLEVFFSEGGAQADDQRAEVPAGANDVPTRSAG